jgi:hypothetical protein
MAVCFPHWSLSRVPLWQGAPLISQGTRRLERHIFDRVEMKAESSVVPRKKVLRRCGRRGFPGPLAVCFPQPIGPRGGVELGSRPGSQTSRQQSQPVGA